MSEVAAAGFSLEDPAPAARNVTLLFSDIEGSTTLLRRLEGSWGEALDLHRRVCREAWKQWDGRELGTEGDSFFVVFDNAASAAAAAVQVQRELPGQSWPGREHVRVRIGIHTGTPTPHGDAYIGMDVHRAARISSAAHGGQIVVSNSTAALLSGHLPPTSRLSDLGQHRLKDILELEHLFQLTPDEAPASFPPLRTLGSPTRLPAFVAPLLGRDADLAAVTELLSAEPGAFGRRLVTLLAPGGTGKTRLAVAAARALASGFTDGVHFVDASEAIEETELWALLGSSLDLSPDQRSSPDVVTQLSMRESLLVLDNLEQVSDAGLVVDRMLQAAPGLKVLATSRKPLHIRGECEYALAAMTLPPGPVAAEAAQAFTAVTLFVEYATMSKAAFTLTDENTADVIEICRRLDGLPLAIELVASRSKLLTPRALLGRLDKALDLSTQASGRPGRQQSLRQAIAWSYDILPPPMQRGFAALSVFAGEVTLEDCEAVLPREVRASYDVLDLVAELQDASLVVVGENPTGDPTVGMLETIRAFAREMLQASGDDAEVRDSHVDHYADLALRLIEEADHGEDASLRHTWPLDNVRIALAWCLSTPEPTARRLEQSVALARVVLLLGNDLGIHTEARTWFEQLLPHVRALDTENTISVILGLAATCRMEGALERSYQLTEQALETPGIDNYPDLHRDALGMSGRVALDMLDLEAAREKLTRGRVLISESDKARIAFWELSMADLESACGDEIGAIPRFRSALALFESLNDEFRALVVRHNLACALRRLGQVPEALAMFRAELEQNLALPAPLHHASFAEDFGACLAMAGHCEYAAQLWGAAETTRRVHDVPRDPGQEAEIGDAYAIARAALADDRWHQAILTGQGASLDDLIREVDGHLD